MKTKFTLLLLAVAFSVNVKAQLQNGGFEDWTNNGTYSDPDHWFSLNYVSSQLAVLICEEGTPGNPGSKYVKLTSKNVSGFGVISGSINTGTYNSSTGDFVTGVPFTQRPASLTGNWQYAPGLNDQGSVYVILTKWNTTTQLQDLIAINSYSLPGSQLTWANFDLPLSYVSVESPDSVQIFFSASGGGSGSPVDGSYLYLDNIAFAGNVSGVNDATSRLVIEVYPNPAENYFFVAKNFSDKETQYEITSVDGKVVQSGTTIGNISKIELKNISSGVYFVNLSAEGMRVTRRIVVR